MTEIVKPLAGGVGFTGRAPGGPSRWSKRSSDDWVRLEPTLVVEVEYDHFTGGRFRHGTKFMRWRPDKAPRQCALKCRAWSLPTIDREPRRCAALP